MKQTMIAAAVASLFVLPGIAFAGVADEAVLKAMALSPDQVMPMAPSREPYAYGGHLSMLPTTNSWGGVIVFAEYTPQSNSLSDECSNFTGDSLTGGYLHNESSTSLDETLNITVSKIRFMGALNSADIAAPNVKNISFDPSSSTVFASLAADGNNGSFINDRDGTIEFNGGSYGGASFSALAKGVGSSAVIQNQTSGTILFKAVKGTSIGTGANGSGAAATIENLANGSIIIQGSEGSSVSGIGTLAYGDSSTIGTIINKGTGSLTIQGGGASRAYGIEEGASNNATATIKNTGSGTISINGGSSSYAYGIRFLSKANDDLDISGYSYIQNEGNGDLIIEGGSGNYGCGIESLAYTNYTGGAVVAPESLLNTNVTPMMGNGSAVSFFSNTGGGTVGECHINRVNGFI